MPAEPAFSPYFSIKVFPEKTLILKIPKMLTVEGLHVYYALLKAARANVLTIGERNLPPPLNDIQERFVTAIHDMTTMVEDFIMGTDHAGPPSMVVVEMPGAYNVVVAPEVFSELLPTVRRYRQDFGIPNGQDNYPTDHTLSKVLQLAILQAYNTSTIIGAPAGKHVTQDTDGHWTVRSQGSIGNEVTVYLTTILTNGRHRAPNFKTVFRSLVEYYHLPTDLVELPTQLQKQLASQAAAFNTLRSTIRKFRTGGSVRHAQ